MRHVTAFVLMVLLVPGAAFAQTEQGDGGSKKLIKILVGGSGVAIGTAIAAKSSQKTTVTTNLGQTETSSFSSSQLATGLIIAGIGGLILWGGLKEHHSNQTTSIGIAGGGHAQLLFLRKTW